jgi:hypothetical protein
MRLMLKPHKTSPDPDVVEQLPWTLNLQRHHLHHHGLYLLRCNLISRLRGAQGVAKEVKGYPWTITWRMGVCCLCGHLGRSEGGRDAAGRNLLYENR